MMSEYTGQEVKGQSQTYSNLLGTLCHKFFFPDIFCYENTSCHVTMVTSSDKTPSQSVPFVQLQEKTLLPFVVKSV